MQDSLGVASYWSSMDYLAQKEAQKIAKRQERDGTPIHKPHRVGFETSYLIAQFKSPRAAP